MKMKEKAEHSRAGVGVDNALVILWGPVQEVTSSRDASKHLLCGLAKGLNGGVAQLPEQETLQSNEKKKLQQLLDAQLLYVQCSLAPIPALLMTLTSGQQNTVWGVHNKRATFYSRKCSRCTICP